MTNPAFDKLMKCTCGQMMPRRKVECVHYVDGVRVVETGEAWVCPDHEKPDHRGKDGHTAAAYDMNMVMVFEFQRAEQLAAAGIPGPNAAVWVRKDSLNTEYPRRAAYAKTIGVTEERVKAWEDPKGPGPTIEERALILQFWYREHPDKTPTQELPLGKEVFSLEDIRLKLEALDYVRSRHARDHAGIEPTFRVLPD